MVKTQKIYIGKEVTKTQEEFALSKANQFYDYYKKNFHLVTMLSDEAFKHYIEKTDYFLVYNRFVFKNKQEIDKRVVRLVTYSEMITEIEENWMPGEEPQWILIPVNSTNNFSIYFHNEVYYLNLDNISDMEK